MYSDIITMVFITGSQVSVYSDIITMVFITGSQSTRLSREGALRLFLSVVL